LPTCGSRNISAGAIIGKIKFDARFNRWEASQFLKHITHAKENIEETIDKKRGTTSNKWFGVVLTILMIMLSVVPRIIHLHAPIMEKQGFRQTQTVITVRSILKDGYSFLHAKTPVLGPPWVVPFEFPIYQITGEWFNRNGCFASTTFTTSLVIFWLFAFSYLRTIYDTDYHHPIVKFGRAVENSTSLGKYFLVADNDWSSNILYYSNRPDCLLRNENLREIASRWLPLNQFTTLVTQHRDDSALKWYRLHEMITTTNGCYIFRVNDPISITNTGR
jgi:hypothetical protein